MIRSVYFFLLFFLELFFFAGLFLGEPPSSTFCYEINYVKFKIIFEHNIRCLFEFQANNALVEIIFEYNIRFLIEFASNAGKNEYNKQIFGGHFFLQPLAEGLLAGELFLEDLGAKCFESNSKI